MGSRTLRILDFGKVAATFIDTCTEESIRIVPRSEARELSRDYASLARNKWKAMLITCQVIPISELFSIQRVSLNVPLSIILARPAMKAVCEMCDEEINNRREAVKSGMILCQTCAGNGYSSSTTASV